MRMQNWAKQARQVEPLYHLWSAVEEFIVKTSVLDDAKSCIGRGTMLETRTVPIGPELGQAW